MKSLVIALSETGKGRQGGGDGGGDLTNVQCKAIQNCDNKSLSLYSEYMLINILAYRKNLEVVRVTVIGVVFLCSASSLSLYSLLPFISPLLNTSTTLLPAMSAQTYIKWENSTLSPAIIIQSTHHLKVQCLKCSKILGVLT
jgi:hypothetical protein